MTRWRLALALSLLITGPGCVLTYESKHSGPSVDTALDSRITGIQGSVSRADGVWALHAEHIVERRVERNTPTEIDFETTKGLTTLLVDAIDPACEETRPGFYWCNPAILLVPITAVVDVVTYTVSSPFVLVAAAFTSLGGDDTDEVTLTDPVACDTPRFSEPGSDVYFAPQVVDSTGKTLVTAETLAQKRFLGNPIWVLRCKHQPDPHQLRIPDELAAELRALRGR